LSGARTPRSGPLPLELSGLESRLLQSRAAPAADLRARTLNAALRAPAAATPARNLWWLASAAAAVLLLFNLARSATFAEPPALAEPPTGLCGAFARSANAEAALPLFSSALQRSCPPPVPEE